MSGHSKWANIQHRKGRQDVLRGKLFTKASKEVTLAAKAGGGDPSGNARLRSAIEAAKAVNLPKDKIETAIKKGTGELVSDALEELSYEGYGPGGVAFFIEAITDNKNRTVSEVRHIITKYGGNMGAAGSVSWMFERKGIFSFDKNKVVEDQLMEIGLEVEIEDILLENEEWQVICTQDNFAQVRDAFESANLTPKSIELTRIPQTTVSVDVETGRRLLKMYDLLDENDDVQNVYANFDLPDELTAEFDN